MPTGEAEERRAVEPKVSRILVAVDGSEGSLKACRMGGHLAGATGSSLVVLCVVPTLSIFTAPVLDDYYRIQRRSADEMLQRCISLLKEAGIEPRGVVLDASHSIVETIVDFASSEGIDLIVVGSRGFGGFKSLLIGSVSSGVSAHARCPVLIVR